MEGRDQSLSCSLLGRNAQEHWLGVEMGGQMQVCEGCSAFLSTFELCMAVTLLLEKPAFLVLLGDFSQELSASKPLPVCFQEPELQPEATALSSCFTCNGHTNCSV